MSLDLIIGIVIAFVFGVSEKAKHRNAWLLGATGFFSFFIAAVLVLLVFKNTINFYELAQEDEIFVYMYAYTPVIIGVIAAFIVYKKIPLHKDSQK